MADDYLDRTIGVTHPDKATGWSVNQDRVDLGGRRIIKKERHRKEIKKQYPSCTIEIKPESRVNPGKLFDRDDWYGTADVTITVTDDQWRTLLIEIIDYKDGRGFVPAEHNTQLQSYAIGANSHLMEIHEGYPVMKDNRWDSNVRMTIVQPKTSTPIRYYDCKLTELVDIAQHLHQAAKRTDDEDAPLIPDRNDGKDWCRWCKHRENCTALNSVKVEKLKIMNLPVEGDGALFELLAKPLEQIQDLSNDRLSELLDAKSVVDGLFQQVEDEIQRRLEDGQKVDGYAMEPGRMSRVWSDSPAEIEKMLKGKKLKKSEIFETKIRSPAQILKSEKLTAEQKERITRDYITEKMGNLKLKKVRRSEEKKIEGMFDDLPQIEVKPEPISFI
jgi:hypothetical protein